MKPCHLITLSMATACLAFSPSAYAQEGSLNIICSVQAEWCNMLQTVYARTTGVKVNMSLKGSREAPAQLIAERTRRDHGIDQLRARRREEILRMGVDAIGARTRCSGQTVPAAIQQGGQGRPTRAANSK